MYFPGDPLQPLDPIFNSIPDEAARNRLVSSLDMARSEPNYALAYAWDVVLRGRSDTPFEESRP
jgi:protocatechuate 3,4-dioxygenase beta subunit